MWDWSTIIIWWIQLRSERKGKCVENSRVILDFPLFTGSLDMGKELKVTHCTGGWACQTVGPDILEKSLSHLPGFEPPVVVLPVAYSILSRKDNFRYHNNYKSTESNLKAHGLVWQINGILESLEQTGSRESCCPRHNVMLSGLLTLSGANPRQRAEGIL